MKKAYKCALRQDQINAMLNLIKDNDNMVEIQLLSVNDDLPLMNQFTGRICSIHLPIEKEDRTCNLSTVLDILHRKDEKFDFLYKVGMYSKKENADIVIHANIERDKMINSPGYKEFIEWLNETEAKVLLENTLELKEAKNSLIMPLILSSEISRITKNQNVNPLLDVCHFQICSNYFDSNLKINLSEMIEAYAFEGMHMHLNTAIGEAKHHHGLHGGNWSENPELLEKIIRATLPYNPIWVLETHEDDMINKPNMVWLNNKIDEILNS